jgi:hypothetical protein
VEQKNIEKNYRKKYLNAKDKIIFGSTFSKG